MRLFGNSRALNQAIDDLNRAIKERDLTAEERDNALRERDLLAIERDGAIQLVESALRERDGLTRERDGAFRERDGALRERDCLRTERDSAVRERDQDRARQKEAADAGRHLVFFHIPRTGGSSIWHALAATAAQSKVPVLDLYHQAQKDFGSSGFAYNVLAENQKFLKTHTALIHSHAIHNISYFLNPDKILYATIVRDPVDRFVSDICHLKRMWPSFSETAKTDLIEAVHWKPPLVEAISNESTSIDAILDKAAAEPFFVNFYYHYFYGLLCQLPAPLETYPDPQSDDDLLEVARLAKNRFAYIGRYPNVAESFHDIADVFQLSHDRQVPFTNHINRLDSQNLAQDRRQRFGSTFRSSYLLLSELGISFLEQGDA